MTDKITIDKLVETIINAQSESSSLCQAEYNEGLRDAADIVKRNRDALIAGMRDESELKSWQAESKRQEELGDKIDELIAALEGRGVLRFKKFSSGNLSYWVWVDENDKPLTGKYHCDWLIAYQTKENVLDHVGKLNLTAEFVEDTI